MTSPTFPFGKHRGLTVEKIAERDPGYLEWALGTDIPTKYPELGAAMKTALAAVDLSVDTVTLAKCDGPSMSARVRGGGALHEGTNTLALLYATGKADCGRRHIRPHWNGLSGSGRSGSYGWNPEDLDDGVYYAEESWGSIHNHSTTGTYYVKRSGEWFKIKEGKRGALAALRPREVAA